MNKQELLQTSSLSEAVRLVYGYEIDETQRNLVLGEERMDGELASAYDSLGRVYRSRTYQLITRDILSRVRERPSGILEAGCGSGLLMMELARLTGTTLLGIELSEDMLKLAEKNVSEQEFFFGSRVRFLQGNIYELTKVLEVLDGHTFESGFGVVISRNVLHIDVSDD